MRAQTIMRVARAIQQRYGREYFVEVFGSTQYGVDSPTSDLDLVVIDPNRMDGFAPHVDLKKLPRVYNIYDLSGTLKRAGFSILQNIAKATVPIVKFKDPVTGMHCDINVNDQLGSLNTALIRDYCDMSPILRPLIMIIKQWAKPLGLNSPSPNPGEARSFSSYSLTLMTIGLLQTRQLLPNLQDVGSETSLVPVQSEFWIRSKTGQRLKCDVQWVRRNGWRSPLDITLEQALIDWFHYWGYEHDYDTEAMSIRHGGVIPREQPEARRKVIGFLGNVPFGGQSEYHSLSRPRYSRPRRASREESEASDVEEPGEDNLVNLGLKDRAAAGQNGPREAPRQLLSQSTLGEGEEADEAESEQFLSTEDADAQPTAWKKDSICVPDPFIRTKNATGPITNIVLQRFRSDCRRAYMMILWEPSLDNLLYHDEPEPLPPRPKRPRAPKKPSPPVVASGSQHANAHPPVGRGAGSSLTRSEITGPNNGPRVIDRGASNPRGATAASPRRYGSRAPESSAHGASTGTQRSGQSTAAAAALRHLSRERF
ncbi:hypothetical protein FA95DRAFT_236995 [Auriscalpium vulgare]|uniref:Uncharacterized protein n=1 Tax=Auriscalpium vulgare TaxID=40419 RepID=A0ACB8S5X2_9AGAM|nr:hypothetical protein FA95DRAFT_236995 [Auriscalpium vulgare]